MTDASRRTGWDDSSCRALLEAAPDAMLIVNAAGTIVMVNTQTEKMFGYPRDEVLGEPIEMLLPQRFRIQAAPERDHHSLDRQVREMAAGLELCGLRKNAEEFPAEIDLSPLETDHGFLVSISIRDMTGGRHLGRALSEKHFQLERPARNEDPVAALEREIVDRRQDDRAWRHERNRAQRYLDAVDVILLALDLDGGVTMINRKGCELLGWTESELVGRNWMDMCVPARAPGTTFGDVVGLNGGGIENPILTRSGAERVIAWHTTVLRDDDGQVIGTLSSGSDITDQRHAEEARKASERNLAVAVLRITEERMRFALQHANVGIWDMDHTTGVLRWSETMEKHYCVPPGTFGGTFEAFIDRIHPDDRASMLKTVAAAMTAGRDFTVEHRTICPDGTVRWLSGAGRTILGAHGEPVRGVGIVQDITTRKQAEATLRQSETRKAAILDSVLDCIVTMDVEGNVIEFNAAAERTFGFTKAAVMGRSLADLIIPPSMRAAHAAGLARYLATGEGPLLGTVIEVTAVRSDGCEIPVELAITAIRSDQAPMFTGVLRDVSGRKQADETRARLAAIVDSSDDAIFSMALDGTIQTWNTGAERLYGYTSGEMIGQNRGLLVPPEKRAELTLIMERAARGEVGEPFETQRTRKDRSIVDISLTVSPMTNHIGRVTGVSTIARDITNRLRAEAEVKRLNDEIQLQRLRVFKATMRTVQDIVNNLLNGLQLVHLEGEGQSPGEVQGLVDLAIQEAAVKLRTLGNLETVREKEMAVGLGIDYADGS